MNKYIDTTEWIHDAQGNLRLSLQDFFAAFALAGLSYEHLPAEDAAKTAYERAHAMLLARQAVSGTTNSIDSLRERERQLREAAQAALAAFNAMPGAAIIAYDGRNDFDVRDVLRKALRSGR